MTSIGIRLTAVRAHDPDAAVENFVGSAIEPSTVSLGKFRGDLKPCGCGLKPIKTWEKILETAFVSSLSA